MLTVFAYRDRETGGHRVRFGGPIELESAGDDPGEGALARDLARVNAAIEAAIREAPEQWLWPHRRFRTRPEGEPSLYPRRRGPLRGLRGWLRRARSS
jgi:lauroyl/myristoyl acyltransferase